MNASDLVMIKNECGRIISRSEMAMCDAISEKLWRRQDVITQVLYTEEGFNIFRNSKGARFDKLYELRKRLHIKLRVLDEVLGIIQIERDKAKKQYLEF